MKGSVGSILILTVFCFAGCNQTPSFIGKWKITKSSNTPDETKITFELKPDKTYVISTPADGYEMTVKGKYTVSDNKVILESAQVDFTGDGTSFGVRSGQKESAIEERPWFIIRTIDAQNIEITDQKGIKTQLRRVN